MKKIIGFLFCILCMIGLASCGGGSDDNTSTPTKVKLETPVLTLTDNIVSWNTIEGAKGYVVNKNNSDLNEQTANSYEISDSLAGTYEIKVKAISSDEDKYIDSEYSTSVTYTKETVQELKATTLWVVGDSTVAEFADDYYYPRYGWGTQLSNYLDSSVTIRNLALSGRSSKSFLAEANYTALKTGIKSGDYLMIGFGHNDEKAEAARYTNPNLAYDDTTKTYNDVEDSFKYVLNHYYVDLAKDAGATPILCTPMVRLSTSYSGSSVHITTDTTVDGVVYPGGDYRTSIIELGNTTNTTVLDLTDYTTNDYSTSGYSNAQYYHAMTAGKYDTDGVTTIPNLDSVDKTHTNIFGAMNNAYLLCSNLKDTSNSLKAYVKADITKPTRADLVKNPSYVIKSYDPFTADQASSKWTLQTSGWYGTVFGDCGGVSKISNFTVKEEVLGEFTVGCATNTGKIGSSEGIAMIFQQVSASKNVSLSATVTLSTYTESNNQTGFGLMLRDDIYIDTFDASIKSNYAAAGVYVGGSGSVYNALYSRVNTVLTASGNTITAPKANDSFDLEIVKVNSTVTVSIGTTSVSYYDFDLISTDTEYMYIGMYATRGTIATFTNVNFMITGDSVQA